MSRRIIRRLLIPIATVVALGLTACTGTNGVTPDPQPAPGQIKVDKVYTLSEAEQTGTSSAPGAASETDGTTTVLLGSEPETFWPTGKVELSSPAGQRRVVYTQCPFTPPVTSLSSATAAKCNQQTGKGSFENPRIERDMIATGDNGFTFGRYKQHNGPIILKADNVVCTSTVNPPSTRTAYLMLQIGQVIKSKPKGTEQDGPPDEKGRTTFNCVVA